jgi:transposase InsO family protein
MRDELVDCVCRWSERTGIGIRRLVRWIGISRSKFYQWKERYGKVNEHNGKIPRDFWIQPWEIDAIVAYYKEHPKNGYRRLTYMMMDHDIVAVSPSTVYRILHKQGLLRPWNQGTTKKGTGFNQPSGPHKHWHIDISYINIDGTFYYLCSILDGYSRYIVHWDIREAMTETDVETILQRAREMFPNQSPRIISDNGPQFISKDFKTYIKLCGMTHVRTSPYYPQSNGKIERWHKSLKSECIRTGTPLSLEDAKRIVAVYIDQYNNERLHSSIGYVTPKDKLEGRAEAIHAARDAKLAVAREARKARRMAG